MIARKPLTADLIDALLANYQTPDDLIEQHGLLKPLIKACHKNLSRRDGRTSGSLQQSPVCQ